jgi:hypothetical protein
MSGYTTISINLSKALARGLLASNTELLAPAGRFAGIDFWSDLDKHLM